MEVRPETLEAAKALRKLSSLCEKILTQNRVMIYTINSLKDKHTTFEMWN